MTQQWIFIRPNDVWLFRDNKPFSAQQNFVARGQFPPNPQVTQGVVRTHSYLNGNHIGDASNMGGLSLKGPFVAKLEKDGMVTRYFQAPLDMWYDKTEEKFSVLKVAEKAPEFISDMPKTWRPLVKDATDDSRYSLKEASGWLTETQFKEYLEGKNLRGQLTDHDDIYCEEERVGLALDYKRKANQQGMFYHAGFTRLHDDMGLLVSVDYKDTLFTEKAGVIGIGGEARFGHYQQVSAPKELIIQTKGTLKVVLLTPSYFSDGWNPKGGDWSHWVGAGQLVSVALGKAQAISGWDMNKNSPKTLRHFVPAGSVFYFENATWQNQPFSESANGSPYAEMGFGTVAVGKW